MKKLIMMIALVATTMGLVQTASAQTFSEGFKQMVRMRIVDSSFDLASMMKGLPDEENGNSALAQRYIKEQMLNDVIDIMASYYEPYVTEDDIKFVCEAYEKPEVKTANDHLIASASMMQVNNEFATALTKLITGQTAEPVKLKEGISKEYADLCTEYCKKAGIASMFGAIGKVLEKNADAKQMEKAKMLLEYVETNTPVVFTNACDGTVTTDDLRTMSALLGTPALQHLNQGTQNLLNNVVIFGLAIKEKWETYKKANAGE